MLLKECGAPPTGGPSECISNHLAGATDSTDSGNSFCEEDYVITFYVAEFVNSLSNLAYGN